MKKLLSLLAFLLVTFTANAQSTLKGDMNDDGQKNITDVMLLVDEILNGSKPIAYLTCPDENHPHLIDLGLSSGTKWACCNVDDDHSKQSPSNYGSYYAWGETKEDEDLMYDWSSYIHCDGNYDTCHNLGSDIAGTQNDVAHYQWGGSWVMPSLDQIEELLDICTSTWTSQNGVYGRVFTGPNGGSIFLPASGFRLYSGLKHQGGSGDYWSSTQVSSDSHSANYLYFDSNLTLWDVNDRSDGRTVRPVSK